MVSTTCPRPRPCRGPLAPFPRPIRPGFTLVELLVVIGIIVLLLGIAITVGRSVSNSGRVRATEHILRTLDSGLSGDIANNEGPPPLIYIGQTVNAQGQPGPFFAFPIVDGRLSNRQMPVPAPWPQPQRSQEAQFDLVFDPPQPSFSLLLLQSGEDSQLARAVQSLDSRFVDRQQIPAYGWPASQDPSGQWRMSGPFQRVWIFAPIVKDGFGNPIRVVMPGASGGSGDFYNADTGQLITRDPHKVTVPAGGAGSRPPEAEFSRSYRAFDPGSVAARRPIGDADEGRPVGARPYLYSAGADGDPGTRRDNVYITIPTFDTETRNFPTPMN